MIGPLSRPFECCCRSRLIDACARHARWPRRPATHTAIEACARDCDAHVRTVSAITARDRHIDSDNDLNELQRLVIVGALMLHLVIPTARLNLALQARRFVNEKPRVPHTRHPPALRIARISHTDRGAPMPQD